MFQGLHNLQNVHLNRITTMSVLVKSL